MCARRVDKVYIVRMDNLRRFVDESSSQSDLAKTLGVSDGFISQIIGKNPSRRIGEKLARQMEERLAIGYGWLDVDR